MINPVCCCRYCWCWLEVLLVKWKTAAVVLGMVEGGNTYALGDGKPHTILARNLFFQTNKWYKERCKDCWSCFNFWLIFFLLIRYRHYQLSFARHIYTFGWICMSLNRNCCYFSQNEYQAFKLALMKPYHLQIQKKSFKCHVFFGYVDIQERNTGYCLLFICMFLNWNHCNFRCNLV